MYQFYMTPGSCSTGIHILLEELDLIFAVNIVNLLKGDQFLPDYVAMNPKSTIPVLTIGGQESLTSYESIAWWLAHEYPKAKLLPDNAIEKARALDAVSYCVNTIHGQGFTRIFTPEKYLLSECTDINTEDFKTKLYQQGVDIVRTGFEYIASQITGPYYFDHFTIVDSTLFYLEFWANRSNIDLPKVCITHYETMKNRPKVKQVLAEEGYRV